MGKIPFLTIIQDILPEGTINTESRAPNVDINIERNYAVIYIDGINKNTV